MRRWSSWCQRWLWWSQRSSSSFLGRRSSMMRPLGRSMPETSGSSCGSVVVVSPPPQAATTRATATAIDVVRLMIHPLAWRLGGLEAWRLGGLEAWRLGGLEAWRLGGLEAWRLGGLEAWRLGGLEAWRLLLFRLWWERCDVVEGLLGPGHGPYNVVYPSVRHAHVLLHRAAFRTEVAGSACRFEYRAVFWR